MRTELEKKALEITQALLEQHKTLSLAESCTGGMIAAALVGCPGVSEALLEGCVCYSNEAKKRTLGVQSSTLDQYGAVSAECAREMVTGIRRYTGSDLALAVTGIAGPGGGAPQKPVGTVYLAVCDGKTVNVAHHLFSGDRLQVRTQSALCALEMLKELI